jgi:hypothetical protein
MRAGSPRTAEHGDERLQLLAARAVRDRPADVAAQAWLGSAESHERGNHDQAAVAERENVVGPGAARRSNRLLGEPLAEALTQMGGDLLAWDVELRREGVEAALVPLVHGASVSRRPGRFDRR